MISFIFLSLALLATVIYFWRHYKPSAKSSSQNVSNRSLRRQAPVATPEPLSEETITEQLCKNEDENVREIKDEMNDPLMADKNQLHNNTVNPSAQVSEPDYIVSVYLMAKEGESLSGYELLQALLSAGLRYGHKKIFHRHEHKDGRGQVLFHCASATPPGTFDLTKMGSFSGSGICLFFSANEVEEPLSAFDCLMETLDQLVDDLGGEVLGEKRTLFTREKLIAHRKELRAIEARTERSEVTV